MAGPKGSGERSAGKPFAHGARVREEPRECEREVNRAHVEAVKFGNAELETCAHRVNSEPRLEVGGDTVAFFQEAATGLGIVENRRACMSVEGVDPATRERPEGIDAAASLRE